MQGIAYQQRLPSCKWHRTPSITIENALFRRSETGQIVAGHSDPIQLQTTTHREHDILRITVECLQGIQVIVLVEQVVDV